MDAKNKTIIQLKISLLDTDPEIFRKVLVYENTPLDLFNEVIQCAMGWENYHMHQFIKNKVFYVADPEPEVACAFRDYPTQEEETEHTVGELAANVRSKFLYEYDFGDSWMHEIRREKMVKDVVLLQCPICIEGQYACPPEDCGGVYGYYNLLEELSDPKNPEYEERLEWLGGDFDYKHFDLKAVNKKLEYIKY